MNNSSMVMSPDPPSHVAVIVTCVVCGTLILLGLLGNSIVVIGVVGDAKMRGSITNFLLLSLAISDILTLVFGIPDTAYFLRQEGWTGPLAGCRVVRGVGLTGLYASILVLTALAIERFVAIMCPLKAKTILRPKRIISGLVGIWIFCLASAAITACFLTKIQLFSGDPSRYCIRAFSEDDRLLSQKYETAFQFSEAAIFYYIPVLLQIICYTLVCRRLYSGGPNAKAGKGEKVEEGSLLRVSGNNNQKQQRRGVIKMLIGCIAVYFISYSPHQVLLIYGTVAREHVSSHWLFQVVVIVLTYVNAAANPILYTACSLTYRQRFLEVVLCGRKRFRPAKVLSNTDFSVMSETAASHMPMRRLYETSVGSPSLSGAEHAPPQALLVEDSSCDEEEEENCLRCDQYGST